METKRDLGLSNLQSRGAGGRTLKAVGLRGWEKAQAIRQGRVIFETGEIGERSQARVNLNFQGDTHGIGRTI